MKLNKLLFLFFALVAFSSCAEYIDYGEKPNSVDFKASLKDTSAKYTGDKFEFIATLAGQDVTMTTNFKINGTPIQGNSYTPTKAGEYTANATLTIPGQNALSSSFKFTVLEKSGGEPEEPEEPEEPKGNRIEYDGNSYPINYTFWIVSGPDDETVYTTEIPINGTNILCTEWTLVSTDNPNLSSANNFYLTEVYVPLVNNQVVFPHETQTYFISGVVKTGTIINEVNSVIYNFDSITNTNANYTSIADINNKQAKLFWNGPYEFTIMDMSAQAKGVSSSFNSKSTINKKQIILLKTLQR